MKKFEALAQLITAKKLTGWQKFVKQEMKARDFHLGDIISGIADEWAKEPEDTDEAYTEFVKRRMKEMDVNLGTIMKDIAEAWAKLSDKEKEKLATKQAKTEDTDFWVADPVQKKVVSGPYSKRKEAQEDMDAINGLHLPIAHNKLILLTEADRKQQQYK